MTVDQAVIDQIVRTVLSELLGASQGPRVLVLDTEHNDFPEKLRKHITPEATVVFLQTGEQATGALEKRYDRVILPCLSCSDMADLAAGRASGEIANAVLSLLLRGMVVEVVDFEYRRYEDSAPAALWDLYRSYEAGLAEFGLKKCEQLSGETCVVRKGLVTEKDIQRFAAQGVKQLTVSAKTVVTSLAADAARSLQIEIIKK